LGELLAEETQAGFEPTQDFSHDVTERERRQVFLQGSQRAADHDLAMGSTRGFVGAAGFAAQGRAVQFAFGDVVGRFHVRMAHEREQYALPRGLVWGESSNHESIHSTFFARHFRHLADRGGAQRRADATHH